MYELSDKVTKPLDGAVLLQLTQEFGDITPTNTAPECSVRNIELCIALMSRNVSPICVKIRDDFLQRNQLPPLHLVHHGAIRF